VFPLEALERICSLAFLGLWPHHSNLNVNIFKSQYILFPFLFLIAHQIFLCLCFIRTPVIVFKSHKHNAGQSSCFSVSDLFPCEKFVFAIESQHVLKSI
jgi:hypothetical protein